jgi:hypothetical protein
MSKEFATMIRRMRVDKAGKSSFCKYQLSYVTNLEFQIIQHCLVNTFGRKKTVKFKNGGSESLLMLQSQMASQGRTLIPAITRQIAF